MRIFLDTRDLIDLLERQKPCELDIFKQRLVSGDHQLALSVTLVWELSAPLVRSGRRNSGTNVMRLLQALETLPLIYIADPRITYQELRSAIISYKEGREYSPIDPYATRFDAAIQIRGLAPTRIYINHSLAETVFTVWQEAPDVLDRQPTDEQRLRAILEADRRSPRLPSLREIFRKKIQRDFQLYCISEPEIDTNALSDWIYDNPSRCPGVRIGYEVFHQIRKNRKDQSGKSDFGDFAHVECLPYIDLMTLDSRMANYVERATRDWNPNPYIKVAKDTQELLQRL